MIITRIQRVFVSMNRKTDGKLFVFSAITTLLAFTILMYLTGNEMISVPDKQVPVFIRISAETLIFILNGGIYAVFVVCGIVILKYLVQLITWIGSLGGVFKESVQEVFEIEPTPPTHKSRITFGK